MPTPDRKRSDNRSKLRTTTLVLIIVGAFIALPTSVLVYNHWRIALNADNYSKAIFVVDEVGVSRARSKSGTTKHRWAEGTIDGRYERIGLAGFGAEANTTEDLLKEFPAGTELDVWHDPSAADITTQGRTLNVIPGTTHLGSAWPRAILFTILFDGILLAGAVGYIKCRRRGIRVF